MTKLPPYEEWDEQWSEGLDLPDADKAWGDMKARLDAEDRKRRFGFFLPLLPCAGWTLLGALALGAGTWLLWPKGDGSSTGQPTAASTTATPEAGKRTGDATGSTAPELATPDKGNAAPVPRSGDNSSVNNNQTPASNASNTTSIDNPIAADGNNTSTTRAVATTTATTPSTRTAGHNPGNTLSASNNQKQHTTATGTTAATFRKTSLTKGPANTGAKTAAVSSRGANTSAKAGSPTSVSGDQRTASKGKHANPVQGAGDTPMRAIGTEIKTPDMPLAQPRPVDGAPAQRAVPMEAPVVSATADSPAPAKPDTANLLARADSAATQPATPQKQKGIRPWTFSAGLSLYHALPQGGQQAWGRNYAGKANPFTEHIPGVWVRAQRGRWSLTADARFHAPQPVADYIYAQKTRWDTAAHSVVTTRETMRKIWYHQLGATVAYRPFKGLSIGVGAQYNLLHQAYAERALIRTDFQGAIQNVSYEPVRSSGYRDSFLYRSQWQLMVGLEYEWKRWSLGIRYRADMEPYIRYTKPNGNIVDKKNDALEAVLRFRLWKSR